jgi:hypothetical protein
MDTNHAIEALRALTPDEIRKRLAEIEGESDALRTLLRSAVARQRAIDRAKRPKQEAAR